MRKFAAIIFLLSFTNSFAQTQAEMNKQAYDSLQNADKELNDVYNKILSDYKLDTGFVKNLKKSQGIWIKFRDAELLMKYPEKNTSYYGSIYPVCRASYL